MTMKLSCETYGHIGLTTGTMGAVTSVVGVWLLFEGKSSVLPSLFLLSWGVTFLAVSMYAYLAQTCKALEEEDRP